MVVASTVYSQNCSGAPTPLMKTGHSLLNMLGIWWERVQKLSTFSYLSSGDGLGQEYILHVSPFTCLKFQWLCKQDFIFLIKMCFLYCTRRVLCPLMFCFFCDESGDPDLMVEQKQSCISLGVEGSLRAGAYCKMERPCERDRFL